MDLLELSPEMLARGRAVLLRYLPAPVVGGGVPVGVIGLVLLGLVGGLVLFGISAAVAALPPSGLVGQIAVGVPAEIKGIRRAMGDLI